MEDDEKDKEEIERKTLKISKDEGMKECATFTFTNEDHTLGNVLRNTILKNKNTEFCAYSVPHPSESLMNVRIQTYGNDAVDVMKKGLTQISKMCDAVDIKYNEALKRFKQKS